MRTLWIICLLAFSLPSQAQVDSVFRFEREFGNEILDFSVDNLGNLYIVGKNHQLLKLTPQGDSVAVFNAMKRYGTLTNIDVTNPLKVLLFYRDFGTVLSLDRFLSTRNTVDLRKLNFYQVKAVGQAYDNNLWVYDEQEGRLKRISEDGKLIMQTNEFRLLFDSLPSPEVIIDQDNLVYLYDPQKGVYIFDHYGSLKNKLPLTGWSDFTVAGRAMYGRKGNLLMKYEPGSLDLRELIMPPSLASASRIRITNSKVYALKSGLLQSFIIGGK